MDAKSCDIRKEVEAIYGRGHLAIGDRILALMAAPEASAMTSQCIAYCLEVAVAL